MYNENMTRSLQDFNIYKLMVPSRSTEKFFCIKTFLKKWIFNRESFAMISYIWTNTSFHHEKFNMKLWHVFFRIESYSHGLRSQLKSFSPMFCVFKVRTIGCYKQFSSKQHIVCMFIKPIDVKIGIKRFVANSFLQFNKHAYVWLSLNGCHSNDSNKQRAK